MEFEGVKICRAELIEIGCASGLGGCPDSVIVDPPVLDVLELRLQTDAWWIGDVTVVKMKLRKELGLLREKLPNL